MSSKTGDRRQRLEQLRTDQSRLQRRSRVAIFGVAVAAVAAITAGVIWAVAAAPPSASPSASGASIAGLKTYTDLSRDHADGTLTYEQTPPVGGAHAPVWQNCGWYGKEVASENAVHSLEHGAVWVTYGSDLDAAGRDTLRRELAGKDYVLASPFTGLPGPVVASAWGRQVVLDDVSDPRLAEFVGAFAGGASTAPEPGGECTGGVGSPS